MKKTRDNFEPNEADNNFEQNETDHSYEPQKTSSNFEPNEAGNNFDQMKWIITLHKIRLRTKSVIGSNQNNNFEPKDW